MKEQILSALRTLLILAGGYLLGKEILGVPVDNNWILSATGIALGLAGVIWSAVDKTLTNDKWQSVVRNVIIFGGGILISNGVITGEMWQVIIGAIGTVFPWILSGQNRAKNEDIKSGEINQSSFIK
jgi:hypothetical protein